jgi:hypothetical protein
VQTQAIAAQVVHRVPLKPPGECHGIPYGVRGLCRNWAGGAVERGPMRFAVPVYRATMVIVTSFGVFSV